MNLYDRVARLTSFNYFNCLILYLSRIYMYISGYSLLSGIARGAVSDSNIRTDTDWISDSHNIRPDPPLEISPIFHYYLL